MVWNALAWSLRGTPGLQHILNCSLFHLIALCLHVCVTMGAPGYVLFLHSPVCIVEAPFWETGDSSKSLAPISKMQHSLRSG